MTYVVISRLVSGEVTSSDQDLSNMKFYSLGEGDGCFSWFPIAISVGHLTHKIILCKIISPRTDKEDCSCRVNYPEFCIAVQS